MERLETARAKAVRRSIINGMYALYPSGVQAAALRGMLRYNGYTSDAEVRKALYYLKGKGYIEAEGELEEAGITLTSLGVNLAEGDIEDLGVMANE